MRLSKQTEYGIRALAKLARAGPNTYLQSRDVAREEGLPAKFLESILLNLRRAGFLESKVGREGGYRLAKPARQILVGDVIAKLEGQLSDSNPHPKADLASGELAVAVVNRALTQATERVLDHLTLEQLVDQATKAAGQAQEMYYI